MTMSPTEPATRILHVCDSVIGGTGSYLAELLLLQADRYGANAITLLMPRQHRAYLEPRLVESGINLAFFHRPARWIGMAILYLAYLRALFVTRPDIVHAHSFGAGVVTRIARVRRRPFVVFCPHGWAFDMDVAAKVRGVIVAAERWLARGANRIVLISHHEVSRALEIGLSPKRLTTVPNGIAAEPPDIAPAIWHDERLKLLFVGRFDRQKGLDVLLGAVRPLGDRLTLRVIGAPVVSGASIAEPLPFVEYIGWQDRDAVAAQMKACDVLVVPSRWEGFGLVAIEAMRLSKPVIASEVGGLAEILDHGKFGFVVPPGDAAALQRVLETVDHADLDAMAASGQARFRSNYTAARMSSQVDAIYNGLLRPAEAA